jgi:hypothetical protein
MWYNPPVPGFVPERGGFFEAAVTPDSMHDSSTGTHADMLRRPRDGESAWSDDELAVVFRQKLAMAVEALLDTGEVRTAAHEKGAAGRNAPPKSSGPRPATIATLLHRPQPSVGLLRRVKDYAKAACKDPQGPLPAEVATALYFGAIASALVHRGERLTTLAEQKLFRGLRWMIGQTWLDDATRDLAQRGLDQVGRQSAAEPNAAGSGDSAADA